MDEIINDSTAGLTAISLQVAGSLALALAVTVIGFNYVKNALNSFQEGKEGNSFDPVFVGKILVTLAVLGFYGIGSKQLVNTIASINNAYKTDVSSTLANSDNLAKKLQAVDETIDPPLTKQEKESKWDKFINGAEKMYEDGKELWNQAEQFFNEDDFIIQKLTHAMVTVFLKFFHWLVQIFVGIIRSIMITLILYYTRILVILGPFAIALSIIGGLEDVAKKWLAAFVSSILAGAIFNICDNFLVEIGAEITNYANHFQPTDYEHFIDGLGNGELNTEFPTLRILAYDFSIIALYLSCFNIAGMVMASTDVGSTISTAVNSATLIKDVTKKGAELTGVDKPIKKMVKAPTNAIKKARNYVNTKVNTAVNSTAKVATVKTLNAVSDGLEHLSNKGQKIFKAGRKINLQKPKK